MYKTVKISEVTEELNNYKLCYIDEIPKTYYDYTPEAKAYRETDEWKEQDRLREEKFQREKVMSSDDPEFSYWANPILRKGADCQEYPEPDYIPGEQELYAYFTPLFLDFQTGDDWNDAPYDCNAGCPYDDVTVEVEEHNGINVVAKSKEITIIRVPFAIKSYNSKLPKDYGYNTPFCVDDINRGAVAWIYDYNYENKSSVVVHAGENPIQFINKIKQIEINNPNWEYYSDEDE